MWNEMKPFVLCAATLAITAGCSHTTTSTAVVPPAPAVESAKAPAAANLNKGKVAEVIEAGRYSYINVDSGSTKTWFAVPSAAVKVGQQVEVKPGMEVKNFLAKTLNRTFETIYFSDELAIIEAARPATSKQLPSWHSPVGQPATAKGGISVAGKVLEVLPGGDYTYARVDQGETDIWVAVPSKDSVEKGQQVKFLPGQEVKNFASSLLNRNFDKVIFSGGVEK